jgi:peroxiredoxin
MADTFGRREIIAAVTAVIVLAGVAWAWLGDSAERAPEVTFEVLDGESMDLADLRERPVIVYFWATDCVTCMREMPDLVELYHDLADEGMELIAVAMSHDDVDDLRRVRATRELPFPIVFDADGDLARAFGNVRVTPTKYLVDPGGRIRMRHIGRTDHAALRERIRALL